MIKTPFRKKLHVVKSGIILDQLTNNLNNSEEISSSSSNTSSTFLTSRFARVLLAGSGFLADAVSISIIN